MQTPVKRHELPQDEAAPSGAALERRKRDRSIARCHAGLLDTSFLSLDAPYEATDELSVDTARAARVCPGLRLRVTDQFRLPFCR